MSHSATCVIVFPLTSGSQVAQYGMIEAVAAPPQTFQSDGYVLYRTAAYEPRGGLLYTGAGALNSNGEVPCHVAGHVLNIWVCCEIIEL